MVGPVYSMDTRDREAVLASMLSTCAHRGWRMLAAHVRSTHLHVVVEADDAAEVIVRELKAYASRRLNERGPRRERYWTRRASMVGLITPGSVMSAVRYVVEGQGLPMAVYVDAEYCGSDGG